MWKMTFLKLKVLQSLFRSLKNSILKSALWQSLKFLQNNYLNMTLKKIYRRSSEGLLSSECLFYGSKKGPFIRSSNHNLLSNLFSKKLKHLIFLSQNSINDFHPLVESIIFMDGTEINYPYQVINWKRKQLLNVCLSFK